MTDKPSNSSGLGGMATVAGSDNRCREWLAGAKLIVLIPLYVLGAAAIVSLILILPGSQGEALAAPGGTGPDAMASAGAPLVQGLGRNDPPPFPVSGIGSLSGIGSVYEITDLSGISYVSGIGSVSVLNSVSVVSLDHIRSSVLILDKNSTGLVVSSELLRPCRGKSFYDFIFLRDRKKAKR